MSLSLPEHSTQPINSNSASSAHPGDGAGFSWSNETGERGDRYIPACPTSLPKPGEIRALRAEIGERSDVAPEAQDFSAQWLRALGAAWTDLPIVATTPGPTANTKPAPTPPKTAKPCTELDSPTTTTGAANRIVLATDLWYAQESIKEPQQKREQLSFKAIRTRPEAPLEEPQSSLSR